MILLSIRTHDKSSGARRRRFLLRPPEQMNRVIAMSSSTGEILFWWRSGVAPHHLSIPSAVVQGCRYLHPQAQAQSRGWLGVKCIDIVCFDLRHRCSFFTSNCMAIPDRFQIERHACCPFVLIWRRMARICSRRRGSLRVAFERLLELTDGNPVRVVFDDYLLRSQVDHDALHACERP